MKRLLTLTMGFILAIGCSPAKDDKPNSQEKPEIKSIKVGDAAPALAVDYWLNGDAVKAIEPGKVYVVDFWATWCGPCIEAMPELGELASIYKDKNVVIFPVTTVDGRNPKTKIQSYVDRVGKRLGVPFAVCEKDTMYKTWFDAAGAQGLPTTFIIDKAGKIAFIGHPLEVADVLPKVVAGTWKGEADLKEIQKMQGELEAIQTKGERAPAEALTDLAKFETQYPDKAKQSAFMVFKVGLMLNAKKHDEAKTYTESILKVLAANRSAQSLERVMAYWVSPQINPDKKHQDTGLKALDQLLALEGKEPTGHMHFITAEVYHILGNKAKAIEYLDSALKLETNPETKKQMEEVGAEFRK